MIGIALLVILGIVAIVLVIVRSSRKSAERRAAHTPPNQYAAPQQPQGSFKAKAARPGTPKEVLLASAHDWFKNHYPESLPQLNVQESYSTLYSSENFKIKAKGSVEGKMIEFGKVQFSVQVHVKDGQAALHLDHFNHLGGGDVPPGGPLVNLQPQQKHKYLNDKGWKFLRDETTKKVTKLLADFEANF